MWITNSYEADAGLVRGSEITFVSFVSSYTGILFYFIVFHFYIYFSLLLYLHSLYLILQVSGGGGVGMGLFSRI